MYRISACFCVATDVSFKLTWVSVYMLSHKSKKLFLWFRFHLTSFNELSNLLAIYTEGDLSQASMSWGIICFAQRKVRWNLISTASMSSLFVKVHSICKLSSIHLAKVFGSKSQNPEPEGHGWKLDEGKLVIDWMSDPPVPDTILEFLTCSCTRAFVNPTCVCILNGLQCTNMCPLSMSGNMVWNEEENENDSQEEHDSEEESDNDELWWLYFCDYIFLTH